MNTATFQKTVNAAAGKTRPAQLGKILRETAATIDETAAKARELGLSGSEIAGVRERLLDAAEARWMRTRYAALNLSFATGVQHFLVGRSAANLGKPAILRSVPADFQASKNECVVELPVFVQVWDNYGDWRERYTVEQPRWNDRGDFQVEVMNRAELPPLRSGGQHYRAIHLHISTKYPDGLTPAMFRLMRKACAYARLFDAALLDAGLIESERHESRDNLGLLWAPADAAWAVSGTPPRPAGDPAVLFQRGDAVYLVGYFDTPDEKPIDNLIREFTEGTVRNVRRRL